MKIYTFLKKPDKEIIDDNSIDLSIKYPLYAITPVKDDAKVFRKSRDMNKFIERVIDVDDDGYDHYLLIHRSQILNRYWLESFKDKNTNNQTPYWINILMTENELNFTMETTDTGSILNHISNYIPIDIFDGKSKKSLYTLRYDKAMYSALSTTSIEKLVQIEYNEGDFWDTGLSFDMFAIFMMLYQSTFSVDFFEFTKISYEKPEGDTFG